MSSTTLLPFQPDSMSPAQLAAVSFLARYSGHTHTLYANQIRRWFAWCDANALNPLVEIQRAHVEIYIRHLSDSGLMEVSGIARPPFRGEMPARRRQVVLLPISQG